MTLQATVPPILVYWAALAMRLFTMECSIVRGRLQQQRLGKFERYGQLSLGDSLPLAGPCLAYHCAKIYRFTTDRHDPRLAAGQGQQGRHDPLHLPGNVLDVLEVAQRRFAVPVPFQGNVRKRT